MARMILEIDKLHDTGYTQVFEFDGTTIFECHCGNGMGCFTVNSEPEGADIKEWNALVERCRNMIDDFKSQYGDDEFTFTYED